MSSYRFSLLWLLVAPAFVFAGMPTVRLSEMARMRIDTMSFFLMAYLLSAWGFKAIWNSLQSEFTSLPRLSYGKSLGVVTIWAALFIVVLTMISGARELLTSGAWERVGATYQVKTPQLYEPPADELRKTKLEQLRSALWAYAISHNGDFPPSNTDPAIAAEFWTTTDPSRVPYAYIPGIKVHSGNSLVAFEPYSESASVFALFASGEIRKLTPAELREQMPSESAP